MRPSCTRCRRDLPARDAGALAALEQAWVDAHLEGCAQCRVLRAELTALLAAGRAWRPAPKPAERDAGYAARKTGGDSAPPTRWTWLVAAAAALLVTPAPGPVPVHVEEIVATPAAPPIVAVTPPPPPPPPPPPRPIEKKHRPRVVAAEHRPAVTSERTWQAPPTAGELYTRAEAALRAGDRAGAAAHLEELLRRWPHAPAATSARLDLARGLVPPARAAALLREVIAASPDGPDARAARRLLCTIPGGADDQQGVKGGCP